MPQKIKNEAGDEIEVFTAEEVTAQTDSKVKEAAESAALAERERLEIENEAALLEKDEELSTTKEALEKLQKKEMNFESLRKQKTLTPEQEEAQKKNTEELSTLRERMGAVEKQPLETAKSTFIENNFEAQDKDGREVFDAFYKKLAVGAKTVEDINKAAVAAFNAVNAGRRQPNLDSRITRTNISEDFNPDSGRGESEASQEFGAMLGLSPESKKKFSGVVKTGSIKLFAQNQPKTN